MLHTRQRTFVFGDCEIKIACRDTPIDSCESSAEEEDDAHPVNDSVDQVGWDIWESATEALCRCIAAKPQLVQNRFVIELGAGVGVVSILAAKLGASLVLCTDYDSVALSLAARNSELNSVNDTCRFENFDWNSSKFPFPLSGDGSRTVLLGSDLMYSSACANKLRKAIALILSQQPAAIMLLSHEIRHSVTWGFDAEGRRQPVVEKLDTVLEAFLSGCKPIPNLPFHNKPAETSISDECHILNPEQQLHFCQLPLSCFESGQDNESGRAVALHEMCSAAQVEGMALTLMRAAVSHGVLSCPDDDDQHRPTEFGPSELSKEDNITSGNRNRDHVQVDTSKSGEVLLFAFALDSHRLARVRDSLVLEKAPPGGGETVAAASS